MKLQDLKLNDKVELEALSTETVYVGKVVRAGGHVEGWEGVYSITVETSEGRTFIPENRCDVFDPLSEDTKAYLQIL